MEPTPLPSTDRSAAGLASAPRMAIGVNLSDFGVQVSAPIPITGARPRHRGEEVADKPEVASPVLPDPRTLPIDYGVDEASPPHGAPVVHWAGPLINLFEPEPVRAASPPPQPPRATAAVAGATAYTRPEPTRENPVVLQAEPWSCATCTFVNNADSEACKVCGDISPVDALIIRLACSFHILEALPPAPPTPQATLRTAPVAKATRRVGVLELSASAPPPADYSFTSSGSIRRSTDAELRRALVNATRWIAAETGVSELDAKRLFVRHHFEPDATVLAAFEQFDAAAALEHSIELVAAFDGDFMLCRLPRSDCVELKCGCFFLKEALAYYLFHYTTVFDKAACPSGECGRVIGLDEWVGLLPLLLRDGDDADVAAELATKLDDAVLAAYARSHGLRCCGRQLPDAEGTCEQLISVTCPPAYCVGCLDTLCHECGLSQHRPLPCAFREAWAQHISEGLLVWGRPAEGAWIPRVHASSLEAWLRASGQRCPGCGVPVEKSEGCNEMTCTRCSTQFCFLCGAPFIDGVPVCETHGTRDASVPLPWETTMTGAKPPKLLRTIVAAQLLLDKAETATAPSGASWAMLERVAAARALVYSLAAKDVVLHGCLDRERTVARLLDDVDVAYYDLWTYYSHLATRMDGAKTIEPGLVSHVAECRIRLLTGFAFVDWDKDVKAWEATKTNWLPEAWS